jgi:predicted secreted hydrolase
MIVQFLFHILITLALAYPVFADTEKSEFSEVRPGYIYQFPRDFASHDDFRIEWWYYTGNLQEKDSNREFGYQLTFFRVALDPEGKIDNPSRWTARQVYFSHLTISDLEDEKFYFFERINRNGLGLAGADSEKFEVWNEDWTLKGEGEAQNIKAYQEGIGLELRLKPAKPMVVHGKDGISRKGESEGNASHYYSFTRMATEGVLKVRGRAFEVQGTSWMDREFSSNQLNPGLEGWDWFSLKLDNGTELMLYQLRKKGGGVDAFSSGTYVDSEGRAEHIKLSQFKITPTQSWTSETTGIEYPAGWKIELAERKISLTIEPDMEDQELSQLRSINASYWEGSVSTTGTVAGASVKGKGYVELVGYGKAMVEAN